jgi:hypothetical protein
MTMATAQRAVETHWYRMCGMRVASCLELPGAAPMDQPIDGPDVSVRYGPVPESLFEATGRGPNWEAGPGRFLLRVPGVARFLLQDGREAWLDPEPGRAAADLAGFVTGSILGVLLHQSGRFVLHASAVAVDGEAVVFCGVSGAGKSAMAAALSAKGYPLVADEVCCFDANLNDPHVIPDGRRLKLWADAVGRLSLKEWKGEAVRPGFEKYWVTPAAVCEGRPLPLRAIYFLHQARLPNSTGIEPVRRLDAVAMIRTHAYRRRLVRALGREQDWLDGCASIAGRTPAFNFTRELLFEAMPDCVGMLEQHWRG